MVFIPKGRYNGQEPMMLVSAKIVAKTKSTISKAPETTPKSDKAMKITAKIKRIVLSTLPMFFFIIV